MAKPNLNRILQLGGLAAGAAYGGLPGAMAGSQLGGMLGGIAGGDQGSGQSYADSVISRRIGQLESKPQMEIAKSLEAVKQIDDPALKEQLARPLLQAQYLGQQRGPTYG